MDLGTTQSGVSFVHLARGDRPTVRMVTDWPGQIPGAGIAKIPTLVAYQHGSVQACGEEAVEAFEDERTTVAHYFKLRLHPEHMKRSLSRPIPSLPPGVTLEQAYCDIMSYMFQHTRKFFESQTGYSAVWRRLRSSIEIILAIPNGWDVREQTSLRRAAINARIVGSWNADTQLKFIPEAEASVHFALHHGTIKSWLTRGCNFVVVDAGGSTVDSTLYVCKSIKAPIHLEEVCSSKCVQAGGIFVDEQAEIMLKRKFRKSRFNHQAYLSAMVRDFEKKTKRLFEVNKTSNIIHVGSPVDTDTSVGVQKGRVSLSASEVASCFALPISDIISSVHSLSQSRNTKYLVLVGGFGESPYLKQQLQSVFGSQGISVVSAEEPSRKAAAEGASIWYLTHNVKARAARYTYGTDVKRPYTDEYRERSDLRFTDAAGEVCVSGLFHSWITKETKLPDDYSYKISYHSMWKHDSREMSSHLEDLFIEVYVWDGVDPPRWVFDRQDNITHGFRALCTVSADLSGVYSSRSIRTGPNGKRYYSVDYSVLLTLGGTELSARIQWKDNLSSLIGRRARFLTLP